MMLAKRGDVYEPISAQEVYRRVAKLHLDLKRVGIEKGDRCAILSENRWEWAVADFAMMTAGIVSVPLYPTLTAEQLQYMLEHSESRVVFVANQLQFEKIEAIWESLPKLQGVIVFEPVSSIDERVITLGGPAGRGRVEGDREARVRAGDKQCSPGRPGEHHLHLGNDRHAQRRDAVARQLRLQRARRRVRDQRQGRLLVVLAAEPRRRAHRRLRVLRQRRDGGLRGVDRRRAAQHARSAPHDRARRAALLREDPRTGQRGLSKRSPPAKRALIRWALEVGRRATPHLVQGRPAPALLSLQMWFADLLVFRKLRARLGGRFRLFFSGSAPLARHLAEFFFSAGIPIYEAYGLTETSPVVSLNKPGATKLGTVGRVIRNVEVRFADDGEILVRGPNVMQGYYKNDEATAQTVIDGWLHTGDIGEMDADGFLKIIDRKKDLFKTSGGKYVAPQPLENLLKTSPYISMAVVIAEGRKFPSVLVVPDFNRVRAFAQDEGLAHTTNSDLAEHPRVNALIMAEIDRICAGWPATRFPRRRSFSTASCRSRTARSRRR